MEILDLERDYDEILAALQEIMRDRPMDDTLDDRGETNGREA